MSRTKEGETCLNTTSEMRGLRQREREREREDNNVKRKLIVSPGNNKKKKTIQNE